MADPDKKAGFWGGIGTIAKIVGVLISAASLLRIVRQHVPSMEVGAFLRFVLETYRATIYPIFETLLAPILRLIGIVIVDPWRDVLILYVLVMIAFIRMGVRLFSGEVNRSGFSGNLIFWGVLVVFGLAWPIWLVLGFAGRFYDDRSPENWRMLKEWGVEVGIAIVAVLLALAINLVQIS